MPTMTIKSDSQRGVALLTILLLVVSITVVAGAMLASQKIAIRRSGLLFDQNQLLQDINAGQQLAVMMLRADAALNDTDSEQDIWAQPIPPYPLANHSISIELRDEASRFNINNLYHEGEVDSAALALFQRLLTQLNLEPDIAIAVLDYQDTDSDVYQDGGDESVVYSQQMNGAAESTLPNQPLVSIEQLQGVRGVDAEVIATLRPYISAIPYYVPININTASPVLLAALMDGANSEQMEGLINMRANQALASIDDIWQLPTLSGLNTEQREVLAPLLAVDSSAFMALITATDSSGSTDSTQARQRFATILLSKATIDDGVTQDGTTANHDNNKQAKEITVVTQRLWAFRPAF